MSLSQTGCIWKRQATLSKSDCNQMPAWRTEARQRTLLFPPTSYPASAGRIGRLYYSKFQTFDFLKLESTISFKCWTSHVLTLDVTDLVVPPPLHQGVPPCLTCMCNSKPCCDVAPASSTGVAQLFNLGNCLGVQHVVSHRLHPLIFSCKNVDRLRVCTKALARNRCWFLLVVGKDFDRGWVTHF